MYNIQFIYLKADGVTQVIFPYVAYTNSYQEAVEQVKVEANKRLEKMGGTIISIS
jgi:hypothetical protein